MSIITKTVQIKHCGNADVLKGKIIIESRNSIVTQFSDRRLCENFRGDDLYDTINQFRMLLEKYGFTLQCNISRYDVFPSGMARNSGINFTGYIHELGKPATKKINLLELSLHSKISTIRKQNEYRRKWIESLKG